VENVCLCTYIAFALVSRLIIATQLGYTEARSTAVFIEGKSKVKTLGIGIYRRCSLEAGKDVSREA
jgi:predicted Na+-dependent transporter